MLPRGGGAEVRKPIEAQAGSAVYLLLSNLRYTPLPLIFWNHEFRARPRSKSLRNKNLWAKYCEIRTYGHNLRDMSRFGVGGVRRWIRLSRSRGFQLFSIANISLYMLSGLGVRSKGNVLVPTTY